jgi:DNA-binding transcriptional MerR regulator
MGRSLARAAAADGPATGAAGRKIPLTPESVPGSNLAAMKVPRTDGGCRSGELARRAGVSADTLRHYERRGLLPAARRTPNGYRLYPAEALERVRLIQKALSLGFTLEELATFLRIRGGGRPPCRNVHRTAVERLSELDGRIEELTRLREGLRSIVESWEESLRQSGEGRPARLLESLDQHRGMEPGGRSLSALRFSRPRRQ